VKQLMPQLAEVRFSQLQLRLELEEDFDLTPAVVLQLRRELRLAIDLLAIRGDAGLTERLHRLLKPEPFADPVARRRFRQPSPAFVLGQVTAVTQRMQAGDQLLLPFILWGSGRFQLPDLLMLFEALGDIGLHHGSGRYRLAGLEVRDDSQAGSPIWHPGTSPERLELPYSDLAWWLGQRPAGETLQVQIFTPARMLIGNRPLFRPQGPELFTAMLRRVTGMIYAWSGVELAIEPRSLIALAAGLHADLRALAWRDWRRLECAHAGQELGGLQGEFSVAGAGLDEVAWVYQLCELFNIGKGATYAGGCCRVCWRQG